MGKELTAIIDVKTRWNSTYEMIRRFLKLRTSLMKGLADVGVLISFTEVELKSLEVICESLGAVQTTLTQLCSRNANFLLMDAAITCLLNSLDNGNPFEAALQASLIKHIQKRRHPFANVLQYLHNGGRNNIHESISYNNMQIIEGSIRSLWNTMTKEEVAVQQEDETFEEPHDFRSQMAQMTKEHCTEVETSAMGKLSSDLDQELLHFRRTTIRGPILNQVVGAIKSIQVTSVEAERSFSLAGRFVNKLRTRLADETISALVILKRHFSQENK